MLTAKELENMLKLYGDDLPFPEHFNTELHRWGVQCKANKIFSSFTQAIDICDHETFLNVNTLLQIASVLPVTTCECERSFSTMRRLNTYLHSTQGSARLDALALINIHCGTKVDIDTIINMFARLHPRKMELSSVLFDAEVGDHK